MLNTREIWIVLRARDQASRTLMGLGRQMRVLDKNALAAAESQMALGSAFFGLGVGLTAAGAAMGAILTSSIKSASTYEKAIAQTKTQTDKFKVSMEEIGNIAKRVGDEIPVPFETIQSSLYDIFSSIDVNAKQSEALLKSFARAAVAGNTDIRTAGRAAIAVLNAYKLPASKVNEVNDTMFQLVRKGVGTYDEFAKNIGKAIPSSVRAGQSFKTLSGMMAFLTRNGLSVAMASTSAARALDAFSNPKTLERLGKLGIKAKNAAGEFRPIADVMEDLQAKLGKLTAPQRAKALQELFKGAGGTIQARRFFDIAVTQSESLTQRIDEMGNAAGAMGSAYDIMANTTANKSELLNNKWKILKQTIGTMLLPVVNELIKAIQNVTDWFNRLSPKTQKFITYAVGIASILFVVTGVVLMVVGSVLMLAGALAFVGISLATFGAIVAAIVAGIAAFIAIGILLYKNWDTVKVSLMNVFDSIKAKWDKLWEKIGPNIKQFGDDLKQFADDVVNKFKEFADGWDDTGRRVASVIKFLAAVFMYLIQFIVGVFAPLWNQLLRPLFSSFTEILGGVLNFFKGFIKMVFALLTGDWADAWQYAKDTFGALWDTIFAILRAGWNIIKGVFLTIKDWIVGIWQKIYDVLVGHSIIPDLVKGILSWIGRMVTGVVNFFKSLPGKIIATLSGAGKWLYQKGKDIVQGLLDGAGSLLSKIGQFFLDKIPNWIVGPFKKALGIASPSKVFRKLGQSIGDGLVVGITGSKSRIQTAMASLTDKLRKAGATAALTIAQNNREVLLKYADKRDAVGVKLTKAKADLEALKKTAADYAKNVKQSIIDTGNVASFGGSFNAIATGMQNAIQKAKQFTDAVKRLKAGGLNATSLDQIIQAGPEQGLAAANAILSQAGGVEQINSLQRTLNSTANALGNTASSAMYSAGIKAAEGLVKGLTQQKRTIEDTMLAIAKGMVRAIRRALGIKSPSTVFRDLGMQVPRGFAQGIRNGGPLVNRAFDSMYGYGTPSIPIMSQPAGMGYGGSNLHQEITINTQEIDPLRHAAELGWELSRRAV